ANRGRGVSLFVSGGRGRSEVGRAGLGRELVLRRKSILPLDSFAEPEPVHQFTRQGQNGAQRDDSSDPSHDRENVEEQVAGYPLRAERTIGGGDTKTTRRQQRDPGNQGEGQLGEARGAAVGRRQV